MASCPLGFGGPGASKGELSSYHCVLCRGLLHEPVITSGCRHVFCGFCIRRFRDCPVCGADIDSTSPDTALASTISKILLGHAKLLSKPPSSAAATPPPGVCPAAALPGATTTSAASKDSAVCPVMASPTSIPAAGAFGAPDPEMDLPSVLLQLALQSLAGGNPEAGLARLDMCADTLCGPDQQPDDAAAECKSQESEPPHGSSQAAESAAAASVPEAPAATTGATAATAVDRAFRRHLAAAQASPDTASRLGVILGCKADCFRRMGDVHAARRHLAASLACMSPWRGRSREADCAMSVTHNKLGDLLMVSEYLEEAREQYESALEIRRRTVLAAAAAGAHACTAAAPRTRREAAEEMVQDLCDLATSLCKVADVGLAIWEQEGGQALGGSALLSPESQPLAPEGEGTAAGQAGFGAARPQEQAQGQHRQQQEKQELAVARLSELLSEARSVLLRLEMMPYAQACELAAPPLRVEAGEASAHKRGAATAAAGLTEGTSASKANAGSASQLVSEPAATAAVGGGGGGGQSRLAAGGVRASGTGDGGATATGLNARLVARYGKVWGALEQLSGRVHELRLACK